MGANPNCAIRRRDRFSGQGVKLSFGQLSNGLVVHVDSVANGCACNCFCPRCGAGLVARQGEDRRHHFAHEREVPCAGAHETALHKFAKQVVDRARLISLPLLEAAVEGLVRVVHPAREFAYTSAVAEAPLSDFVPDLLLLGENTKLVVEIAVAHFSDSAKKAKLRSLGLPATEIDLSALPRDCCEQEATLAILQSAPRKWLFHPGHDPALRALSEQRERERAQSRALEEAAAREARRERALELQSGDRKRQAMLSVMHSRSEVERLMPEAGTQAGREAILEREAMHLIGKTAIDWMCSRCDRLEGHSPRAYARDSVPGLLLALACIPGCSHWRTASAKIPAASQWSR